MKPLWVGGWVRGVLDTSVAYPKTGWDRGSG